MYKVITKERPNSTNTLVCELINRATGEWNIDKLNSWFIPEDRDAILGIPLSSSNTQDRMIWAENSSGKFTVKSAHTLALEESLMLPGLIARTSQQGGRFGNQYGA